VLACTFGELPIGYCLKLIFLRKQFDKLLMRSGLTVEQRTMNGQLVLRVLGASVKDILLERKNGT
jgi:hypothetical protein